MSSVLCDYNLHIVASMYSIFFQERHIKYNLAIVCIESNVYLACTDNSEITIGIVHITIPNMLSCNLAIVCTESNACSNTKCTIDIVIVHTTTLTVSLVLCDYDLRIVASMYSFFSWKAHQM